MSKSPELDGELVPSAVTSRALKKAAKTLKKKCEAIKKRQTIKGRKRKRIGNTEDHKADTKKPKTRSSTRGNKVRVGPYDADMKIISSGEWLSDNETNAGQWRLKEQYPSFAEALQDTVLGMYTYTLTYPIKRGTILSAYCVGHPNAMRFKRQLCEGPQMLNVDQNHWVAICVRKDEVLIADSMRTTRVRKDIRAACEVLAPEHKIRNLKVQQQKGMDDCGLFALAFCEAWCRLEDVEDLSFDQGKMREHLEKCLRSRDQQLTAFPLLQRKNTRSKSLRRKITRGKRHRH